MGHDVFISHAATDKIIADEITTWLEKGGVRCWVAPRDIRPGDTWGGSIVKAIEDCSIMVIVFSQYSNKSRQVLREVERAIQKNVVALPFRIDDQEPTGDMEYFLSATHWLDAMTGDMEMHYEHLLQTTLSILEREALENEPALIEEPEPVAKTKAKTKAKAKAKTKPKAEPKLKPEKRVSRRTKVEPVFDEKPVESAPGAAIDSKADAIELETHSEMELANELDQAREFAQDNIQIDNSSTEKTATEDAQSLGFGAVDSQIQEPSSPNGDNSFEDYAGGANHTNGARSQPELVIDGGQKRRVATQPEKLATPKVWMGVAAAAIPVIAGLAWFLMNDKQQDLVDSETVAVIENTADKPGKATEESKKAEPKKTAPKKETVAKKKTETAPKKTETIAKAKPQSKPAAKPKDTAPKKEVAPEPIKAEPSKEELEAIAAAKAAEEKAKQLAAEKAAAEKAFNDLVSQAEGGDVNSQLELARKYQSGNGVERSSEIATTWFSRAAEAGNPQAQFTLSKILSNSGQNKAALSWLIKSAEQDNITAQTQLAEKYSSGDGVEQSDPLALQWFQRAAKLGDLEAQKNLATLFEFGIGTNKNLRAALKWYRAAADQGDMSSKLYVEKLLEKAPALQNEQSDTSYQNCSTPPQDILDDTNFAGSQKAIAYIANDTGRPLSS